MAINFNSLPNKRPSKVIPKGAYYATIMSADMKQGKIGRVNIKKKYANFKFSSILDKNLCYRLYW